MPRRFAKPAKEAKTNEGGELQFFTVELESNGTSNPNLFLVSCYLSRCPSPSQFLAFLAAPLAVHGARCVRDGNSCCWKVIFSCAQPSR